MADDISKGTGNEYNAVTGGTLQYGPPPNGERGAIPGSGDLSMQPGEQMPRKFNPMQEFGLTGLPRFGGFVYEEWLQDLVGIRGRNIYREMRDNDPIIGAILFTIEMLCRQVSWSVKAGGDSPADQEAADFLNSCMHDMSTSWHDFITEALSMFVFGWSWHEICYKKRGGGQDYSDPLLRSKYDDGRIGWRKLPIRAQETLWRWTFDNEGGIKVMNQLPPPDFIPRRLPIEKALLFRTKSYKNNPEGRSCLRTSYRAWYFKKHIEEIEAIGVERDLAGLPVALVPPEILDVNASDAEKAVLTYVMSLRRDELEGVVFPAEQTSAGTPSGYKLTLLSAGGSGRRQFDTNAIIMRYNQQIACTVMADFILLGQNKVGSFALHSDKTELFAQALAAWLDAIAEVINRHGVPRLFALNTFPGITKLPEVEHGQVKEYDLPDMAAYITALSGAGMQLFPDDELENQLRRAANLVEKQKDSDETAAQGMQEDQGRSDQAGGNTGAAKQPGDGQTPEDQDEAATPPVQKRRILPVTQDTAVELMGLMGELREVLKRMRVA